MVALVAFGVLALGWEKRAEREELRARCRSLVEPLREDLRSGLAERNVLAGLGPVQGAVNLPLPGGESETLKRFTAGDFSGVLGESSSLSEAGLPLRTLAALRLLREEIDPARREELTLIIAAEPSIVTPRLLGEAERRHRELGLKLPPVLEGWEDRLELQERVRSLLEREGELLLANQPWSWIAHEGRRWFALREGPEVLLIEEERVQEVITTLVSSLEASLPAGVRIEVLFGDADRNGEPVLYESVGDPPIRFVI